MIRQNSQATDDRPLNRSDIRMVITAGLGFFTDAYDLFIIGIVTTLLIPLWHLSITQVAIMNGTSLIAAAVGAISFGWLLISCYHCWIVCCFNINWAHAK